MTPEQIDLLPCPFCGGENLGFQRADIDGWIAHVQCIDCDDMVGPMSSFKYDEIAEAEQDAATLWNRRASPVNAALAEDAARAHDLALKNARLREALEFYADRKWDGYDVNIGDYGISMDTGTIIKDGGDIARAALDEPSLRPDTHASTAALASARDSIPEGE